MKIRKHDTNRRHSFAAWAVIAIAALAIPVHAAGRRNLAPVRGEDAPYRLTSSHFIVEFSLPPREGARYIALCERAYRNFCKKFNVSSEDPIWRGRCNVIVFRNRSEFERHSQQEGNSRFAAQTGGYTRVTKLDPDIVLYLDSRGHTRLRQVLVHELTHVFLQLFHKQVRIETWLHEGLAQYFEFTVARARSRVKASRARAKKLVKSRKARSLESFLTERFPGTDVDAYAQAWSLVDFMINKGSVERTGRFILSLKEGMSQQEALRRNFACSLDKFELLWKRYVITRY